jgi:uncharacterized protein
MKNLAVWFEIPVQDMKRAITFYAKVLNVDLQPMEMGTDKFAMFPFAPGVASGALVESKKRKPSSTGALIYIDGGDDLSAPLKRAGAAGGKVVQDKTSLGNNGFMAIFEDTEGNHVGLHSMN